MSGLGTIFLPPNLSFYFSTTKFYVMEESRTQNTNREQNRYGESRNQGNDIGDSQSGMGSTDNRGSEGLGGESMGTSSGTQSDMHTPGSSPSDYASAGQPLEGGDSGRGGSTGTGNTDRSSEGMGGSQLGEGGM